MKRILFFASALLALASCTSDEFTGDKELVSNNDAITIGSNANAITRASGAEAAALLNNNFVVEGIKTVSTTVSEVFDNYNVNYIMNSAGTTASNSANWEYVAQAILTGGKTAVTEQTIKYWDYAATQYDFWAYSLGGGSATVTSLSPNATASYTITGNKTDLSKVFISDLTTLYAASENVTGKPVMGDVVNLSFRSLVTKARIGFYETIPGYSIKSVQFYPSASGTPTTTAALYASSEVLPSFPASGTSTYTVSFTTIGKNNASNADYNKAHVTFNTSGTKDSKVEFGTLAYGAKHGSEKTSGNIWLCINSASPTWAVETSASAGDYSIIMPNENGEVLTLKVDYTLESTDGSGDTITVHGATALIPSQYTQWKSNYAYTYLFKISDNTNGLTNTSVTNKEGLYPITLDAVVVGSQDGTQETITTLATPSITTYSLTSDVTTNNEYTTSDDIYVTASTNGTLMNMTGKATLYDVTKASVTSFTEAEVLAALTSYSSLTSGTYIGRNGISLAPVANALSLNFTTLPTVDGRTITINAGDAALIDKSKLTAGHIYAFVFDTTSGTPTTEDKYEAVKPANGVDVSSYYTDATGATQATGTADGNTIYYAKYTVVSNATYGIKVIKIKS